MVSFANSSMVPKLKLIWQECFGDTSEYINFYYANRFRPEHTLVYLQECEPVAMLTLLPAELMQGGVYHPIAYVYAVATMQNQRGRGLSTKLLAYAKKWLTKNSVGTMVLAPEGEKLFEFYRKRGYTTAFKLKIAEFEATEQTQVGVTCKAILPVEYKALRDAFFSGEGYLRWGIEAISYALAENAQNGGFAVKIIIDNKEYAVLGSIKGDILNIRETTLTNELICTALSYLARKNGCKKIVVASPANSTLEGTIRNMGMSDTPMQSTDGYMNLALD